MSLVFAQTAADPVATFELWWVVLGPIVSLVFPWVVKTGGGEAGRWFRFWLSLGIAAAVSVVTVYQSVAWDAQEVTAELVLMAVFAVVGSMKVTYELVDGAIKKRTGGEEGLNDLAVYWPDFGLPGPLIQN